MRSSIVHLVLLLAGIDAIHGQNSCLDPDSSDYRCQTGTADLDLNDCSITDDDIPDVEACLDNVGRNSIASLDLENNSLTTLPADIFKGLGAVVQLYLQYNKLSALSPGAFNGPGNLVALYLEGNDLTTLPEGLFDELGSLQTLYLALNPDLQCVPDTNAVVDVNLPGVCGCTPADAVMCDEGVCSSGASGYSCDRNPCFDKCQSGDSSAQLHGCGLTDEDIPDLVKCFDEIGRDNIEYVNLGENGLTTLPTDLFQGLEILIELDLYENKLSALEPGLFDGLVKLNGLYIWKNDLTTLPMGLFNELESLTDLSVGYNDLSALTTGVFDGLGNLTQLTIRFNKISVLSPGVFDALGKLSKIEARANELTTLPAGLFSELGNLKTLQIHDNQNLQCLPDTVATNIVIDDLPLDQCECTPVEAVMCDDDLTCAPGASGYTCEMAMHKLGAQLHLSDARST